MWSYIYEPNKVNEVLAKTKAFLDANPPIADVLSNIGWAFQSLWKLIPHTTENFFSGHSFAQQEGWEEFQVSVNLAALGLYKQSFTSLRSGLELGLLSIYFNIDDNGAERIRNWLRSRRSADAITPRTNSIWKALLGNKNIATFNEAFGLRDQYDALSDLSNYVHTRGVKYSNTVGLLKSNYQTFEEEMFLKWLKTYGEVVAHLATVSLLRFPIGTVRYNWSRKCGIDNPYPVLETWEIERIKRLVSEKHFAAIEELAKTDPETKALLEYILEQPDMTDDEKEEQMLNFDKMSIEHGPGFIEWEKSERNLMERYDQASRDRSVKRIEILRTWASENDMMYPMADRKAGPGRS